MPEDRIRKHFESGIAKGLFPSAAWSVSKGGKVLSEGASGYAVIEPERSEASIDTIYDLASLTKPLVTGLLALMFAERGTLGLGDPVSRFIPEFARKQEKRDVTIEDLLTHRSGFEAWRPLYLEIDAVGRAARLEAEAALISELELEAPRGSRVIYSDLNYILLCLILERAGGDDLSKLFDKMIAAPLGLEDTGFNPGKEAVGRIAASEKGNAYEKAMAESKGFEVSRYDWRSEVIVGEVHDGNAFYLAGISGHAGLFSTVRGTVELARQFLPGGSLLGKKSFALVRNDLTKGLGQSRSIGFQMAETESSSAHGVIPNDSFGHLGFTGTTLWIDPSCSGIYVALTNRTHAAEPPFADLTAMRRDFLELAHGQM